MWKWLLLHLQQIFDLCGAVAYMMEQMMLNYSSPTSTWAWYLFQTSLFRHTDLGKFRRGWQSQGCLSHLCGSHVMFCLCRGWAEKKRCLPPASTITQYHHPVPSQPERKSWKTKYSRYSPLFKGFFIWKLVYLIFFFPFIIIITNSGYL